MAGMFASHWRAAGALLLALTFATSARAQDSSGVETIARRAASGPVRSGDRIVLHFLRDRELSDTVEVNERGEAAFPKLGILHVADMSIGAVQDTLRARYSEYLRVPELEVSVLRRIVVNGEVKIPNVYMVDGTSTVRDVIARAGGILETGNKGDIEIVRAGNRIRVHDWERGDASMVDL